MPKVSRPIVYTAVFAVAAYAVFLYTQPPAPASHKRTKTTVQASAAPDGFLPEDLTAHFARYTGKGRDAFTALVTGQHQEAANNGKLPGKQAWALTGITTVDGATTAIVENQGSGESAYLKPGDTWRDLKVVSVDSTSVTFRNELGQDTKLAFSTTAPETVTASAAGAAAPSAPALPTGQQGGGPLVPMPIQPLPGLQGQGPQNPDGSGLQPGVAGQDGQPQDTQGQYGFGGGNGFGGGYGGGGGRRRRRQFGSY